MKAVIKDVIFQKEFESKFGTCYSFKVLFDDKTAYYTAKKKEQDKFIKGKETEFTVEEKDNNGNKYLVIKPITSAGFQNSGFGKALKKEQSKYSGFAMSYAKDLVVANKINLDQMSEYTKKMFTLMVELDKTLEQ